MNTRIVYLDRQVCIAYKPCGMLTQTDPQGRMSLEDVVKQEIGRVEGREKVFLHATHRLDRVTSGLVILARTSKALSRLHHSFRDRKVEKWYRAEVMGHLARKKGKLEHRLTHASFHSQEDFEGKWSCLDYKVLQEHRDTSVVEIALHTGRYHQIRAQFSLIGHPLVGDQKYGGGLGRIDLCHIRCRFPHPVTKQMLEFSVDSSASDL